MENEHRLIDFKSSSLGLGLSIDDTMRLPSAMIIENYHCERAKYPTIASSRFSFLILKVTLDSYDHDGLCLSPLQLRPPESDKHRSPLFGKKMRDVLASGCASSICRIQT